ncbi:MAG: Meiotic Sister-Chromatid recombination aldehyde dehydrogenase [Icmadophila ericetorum]|nr:Meiotic Sister-Chromatid recombination aldehyde dehydrogenase [Icmadophila ericetorum]
MDYLPTRLPTQIESLVLLLATGSLYFILTYFIWNSEDESPVHFTVQTPEQCNRGWKGQVIDEPSIKVTGLSGIQCYCPANGKLLGHINPATQDGIDRAVARAKDAQTEWAKTTWAQRRKVLRTILNYVLANQETIATVACLDSGKTKVDACFGEILVTVEKLKWTIDHGEKSLRSEQRPTSFLMMYKRNEVRWEPLGVVAACFHNFIGPIISSLFAGNAIVVKASERTAWSTVYYANIVRLALAACGHSNNLIQSVVCWPQQADHLTSHPDISHITFIGSRPVAHHVCASAAKALIPVCVELGGKDPAIILDDVKDMNRIGSFLMRGVFQSAGQNCIGIERKLLLLRPLGAGANDSAGIIALPKVYAKLVQILEPRIKALKIGSALDEEDIDMGAMISDDSFSRIESLISAAVSQGAKLLVGGKCYIHPLYSKGHYFSPTLLINVTAQMKIAQEEVFGPVCLMMRASSVSHAIQIANSTNYALGASVFGTSHRDLEVVTSGVKAGMISVNDFAVYYAVQLPFGGVGGSGYGRFAGEEGLRSLCNLKAVCRDRFPRLLYTSIPNALDYPIGNAKKAWTVCTGVVGFGYGMSWADKATGIWKIVTNS